MSAAQTPVKSIQELQEIAAKDTSKSLLLNVARGNGALFVVLDKD